MDRSFPSKKRLSAQQDAGTHWQKQMRSSLYSDLLYLTSGLMTERIFPCKIFSLTHCAQVLNPHHFPLHSTIFTGTWCLLWGTQHVVPFLCDGVPANRNSGHAARGKEKSTSRQGRDWAKQRMTDGWGQQSSPCEEWWEPCFLLYTWK